MRKLSELVITELFLVIICNADIMNLLAQLFALAVIAYFEFIFVVWKLNKHELSLFMRNIMIGLIIILLSPFEIIQKIIHR